MHTSHVLFTPITNHNNQLEPSVVQYVSKVNLSLGSFFVEFFHFFHCQEKQAIEIRLYFEDGQQKIEYC